MLKLYGFIISIVLIIIIFLRIPRESAGLTDFATKSNILGSPSSAQRFLNILITFGTFLFFVIAVKLNLANN